jgi:galactose-1-phosphate uridylyltransferase
MILMRQRYFISLNVQSTEQKCSICIKDRKSNPEEVKTYKNFLETANNEWIVKGFIDVDKNI